MRNMDGEQLFWELAQPLLDGDPAVTRSTMMGLPCLRHHGRFFASLDRRTLAMLVKLPAARVAQLIADGDGAPFAPAGRVFREWVALTTVDRRRWRALLREALQFVTASPAPPNTARRERGRRSTAQSS